VTAQGEPEPDDARVVRIRRLVWAAGTLVGLWFVADGLSGLWSGAGVIARALIAVAAVVVVVLVVLGVAYVLRRERTD
jgi:anti-sigma-K factor RskA